LAFTTIAFCCSLYAFLAAASRSLTTFFVSLLAFFTALSFAFRSLFSLF